MSRKVENRSRLVGLGGAGALAFGLAHLLLVGLGAVGIDFDESSIEGRMLALYSNASGADRGYDFFAPGVTGQYRVQFDLIDHARRERTVELFPPANGEATLRFGDIVDQFATSTADDEGDDDDEQRRIDFARSLSASLAGAMFARHQDSLAVRVRVDQFSSISMAEYRAGTRAHWQPLYQAKFVPRPLVSTEPPP